MDPVRSQAQFSDAELRDLIAAVRELQQRVGNLELRIGVPAAEPTNPAAVSTAGSDELEAELSLPDETVPALGRALLAIAGAYLLRALAELGALPRAAGAAAGIAYAVLWLWLSARTHAGRKLAVTIYALTSVSILAPLLWEVTIRFREISSWTAASVIVGFSLTGQLLSWRRNSAIINGIASLSAAIIGIALLLGTHNLPPYTLALLITAAGVEAPAWRGHPSGSRWFVAGIADLSILIFSVLIVRQGGLPEGYAPASPNAALAAQAFLLAIYVAGAAARTVLTIPEMAQALLAFAIGAGGAFRIAETVLASRSTVGVFALVCGVACFSVRRNFRIFSVFGLIALVAGSYLLFSGMALVALLSGLGLACCWRPNLGLHGAAALFVASLISGVVVAPESHLFGAGVVAVGALLSYLALVRISPAGAVRWDERLAALAVSATLVWVVSALARFGLAMAWRAIEGQGRALPAAILGSATLAALAVLAAWSGARWRREELIWLVYGLMAVAAFKLAVLDFPRMNALPMVVSLLLYGGTLLMLPRILRSSPR